MSATNQPFPSQEGRTRSRLRVTPGLVVLLLLLALVSVVTYAVVSQHWGGSSGGDAVTTIATLRANPDGWDGRAVTLRGSVQDVRTIPYLDQYALYTFTDDTGNMRVLSRNGAPPESAFVELRATFHSRITLDRAIKLLLEDQIGSFAAALVDTLLPGIPLDVVYLEHSSYSHMET